MSIKNILLTNDKLDIWRFCSGIMKKKAIFCITDYGRPVRKSPSLHGRKSTPTPKFFTPGLSGFWDQSQANSALYSAFWSVEQTDFKNVIVENIHWALFEDAEVAEVKDLEIQNDENSIIKSDKN